jgi:hypothetical protein
MISSADLEDSNAPTALLKADFGDFESNLINAVILAICLNIRHF